MTQMTSGQEARKQMMVSTGTYCATAQDTHHVSAAFDGSHHVARCKHAADVRAHPQRCHVREEGADEAKDDERELLGFAPLEALRLNEAGHGTEFHICRARRQLAEEDEGRGRDVGHCHLGRVLAYAACDL